MQTKIESIIEANANTFSGFLISWAVMAWVIPFLFTVDTGGPAKSGGIVLVFTIIAILRNYIIRRIFNKLFKK